MSLLYHGSTIIQCANRKGQSPPPRMWNPVSPSFTGSWTGEFLCLGQTFMKISQRTFFNWKDLSAKFMKHKEKLHIKTEERESQNTHYFCVYKEVCIGWRMRCVEALNKGCKIIALSQGRPLAPLPHFSDIYVLALKMCSDREYITFSDDLFQCLFQTIRNH